MRTPASLRSQLLLFIGGPLLVLLLIETLVSWRIAIHTATLVFDRWLLDSAHSLGQEIEARDGKVYFKADSRALALFEWDDSDDVLFQIFSPDQGLVAGTALLQPTDSLESLNDGPEFRDLELAGSAMRVVSLLDTLGDIPVVITVAETLKKRQSMGGDLLFEVVISKVLLLIAALAVIGTAFDRGLRPLTALNAALSRRSPQDLTPVEVGDVPLELRGLVESTNRLLGRIETAINSREQFIGNIAHQIRTPLAGMKLHAQIAQDSPDPDVLSGTLERIVSAVDHMAHVNTQLLKLARAEAATGRGLKRQDTDLTAIARGCCTEFADKARARGISLVAQSRPQIVTVGGDATLLSEMVSNLVDNAIAYGVPGGHVWVRTSVTPTGVQLVVEDDGPGIPHEYWPRLFDRFFRPLHSTGNGCGLGLSIVREIAFAHGASAHLDDREQGLGARFVVTFPSSDH